jgi:hypothetical protein
MGSLDRPAGRDPTAHSAAHVPQQSLTGPQRRFREHSGGSRTTGEARRSRVGATPRANIACAKWTITELPEGCASHRHPHDRPPAPNLKSVTALLGVGLATVKKVLASWGPSPRPPVRLEDAARAFVSRGGDDRSAQRRSRGRAFYRSRSRQRIARCSARAPQRSSCARPAGLRRSRAPCPPVARSS